MEQDASGSDLKVFIQLIDTYGPEVVIDIIDPLSPEETAETVVPHRPQGQGPRTADRADRLRLPPSHNGQPTQVPRADAMLAYVALPGRATASTPKGWPG